MSTAIQLNQDFDVSKLVIDGDVSKLSPDQKSQYYLLRCKEHGLNPSSQPFNYLQLNGKTVLYANKGCAEQLRSLSKVSIKITKADMVGDLFVVIAEAKNGAGREDSATGAVPTIGLKGEALANAMMKAETKAKRRVTLSICGMNMLDETEIDSIPNAQTTPTTVIDHGFNRNNGPSDADGNQEPGIEYRVDFGQWNRRSLEEIYRNVGGEKMADYINYLESDATKKQKPITPDSKAGIFIREVEAFLGAMEN